MNERYYLRFEDVNIGDVFDFQKSGYSSKYKLTVLDKDNWNKILVIFESETAKTEYGIMDCDAGYIFRGFIPYINSSYSKDLIYKQWEEQKSKLSKEDAERIIRERRESLHTPISQRKSGSTETMTQWSNYNSKVMGWKGR